MPEQAEIGIPHDTERCHSLARAEAGPGYAESKAASALHPDSGAWANPARSSVKGIAGTLARSAALTLLGFAAAAMSLHLRLRRELRDAPEDVRSQGWPIQLVHVLFAKFVIRWIDVEGLENLPGLISRRGQPRHLLYEQASDLIEAMLINAPTSRVKSSMIASLGDIYVGHFRLAAFRLHDNPKAFRIIETARGRARSP